MELHRARIGLRKMIRPPSNKLRTTPCAKPHSIVEYGRWAGSLPQCPRQLTANMEVETMLEADWKISDPDPKDNDDADIKTPLGRTPNCWPK